MGRKFHKRTNKSSRESIDDNLFRQLNRTEVVRHLRNHVEEHHSLMDSVLELS